MECYSDTCNLAAACMTWDLAESGKQFITTIINGSDLVPTFSTASIDDLRSEVEVPFVHVHVCVFVNYTMSFILLIREVYCRLLRHLG